jgi:hypothetical protein
MSDTNHFQIYLNCHLLKQKIKQNIQNMLFKIDQNLKNKGYLDKEVDYNILKIAMEECGYTNYGDMNLIGHKLFGWKLPEPKDPYNKAKLENYSNESFNIISNDEIEKLYQKMILETKNDSGNKK